MVALTETRTSQPNWIESFVAAALRQYPLLRGHVYIVRSKALERLAPRRSANVWARIGRRPILVPLDDFVGRSIFLLGGFEPRVSWCIREFVRQGDTVVDVGANLGCMSLLMAQQVGESGRTIAFEPSPRCLPYLEATLSRNKDLRIELSTLGLAETSRRLTLSVPPENLGRASLVKGRAGINTDDYEVEVVSFTDFCQRNNVRRVDFMKLDVEGFESEVLKGIFSGDERIHPKRIVFEQRRGDSDAIALCQEHGYGVLGISHAGLLKPRLVESDSQGFHQCMDFIATREA